MHTAVIILAAGKGERVATIAAKPFLKFQGKSFLEISVEKAQKADFDSIIVVTSKLLVHRVKYLNLNIEVVVNLRPEMGMLSSIHCGLDCLHKSTTGFLLNPVDFPLVEQKTYHKLWESHQNEKDCIIKPVYKGKAGHPVIFPAVVFNDLKKAPLNKGAKFVLQQHPNLIRELEVDDPGILININTPEVYNKYSKQI